MRIAILGATSPTAKDLIICFACVSMYFYITASIGRL
jgi:hypothetical protein